MHTKMSIYSCNEQSMKKKIIFENKTFLIGSLISLILNSFSASKNETKQIIFKQFLIKYIILLLTPFFLKVHEQKKI